MWGGMEGEREGGRERGREGEENGRKKTSLPPSPHPSLPILVKYCVCVIGSKLNQTRIGCFNQKFG